MHAWAADLSKLERDQKKMVPQGFLIFLIKD